MVQFLTHCVVFGNIRFVVILLEITEKDCVRDRYRHSKARIRLVQHRAAISAIAELWF